MGCPMDVLIEFEYDISSSRMNHSKPCFINNKTENNEIIEFYCSSYRRLVLDYRFNINNLLKYLSYFYWTVNVNFVKFKGFELNLIDEMISTNDSIVDGSSIRNLLFIGSTMDFYINGRLVRTCEEIMDANITIRSILQAQYNSGGREVYFDNCELKRTICPLVFRNTMVDTFFLIGMIDTFYKRNVLKFWKFDNLNDLNSSIRVVQLAHVENVNIDLNLFNPSVFADLQIIFIAGFVNSISHDLFGSLKHLKALNIDSAYFRKLMNNNGIEWIRMINKDINVNLLNDYNYSDISKNSKLILASCSLNFQQNEPVNKIFPDEDFCLYTNFPFNQLIIMIQYCTEDILNLIADKDIGFSCTYLWINQYLSIFEQYLRSDEETLRNFHFIINSTSFKSIEKCGFSQKLDFCNKSSYRRREIWMTSDYYLLNKKLQSGMKILTYLSSLVGIVTNLLVTIIILLKRNNELFKGYKHYTYLCLNSLFGLLISITGILSWMTDCFYPFGVFCPEIRKIYFFQRFKIIVEECLMNSFRFMLNFCYVAFALNRISLLGKDHGKLVEFMSQVGVKKYVSLTFLLSILLSVIKYFKFTINTGNQDLNYPISNEKDIFRAYEKKSHTLRDVYFIVNSISDLVNYVVLVIICFGIDVFMVNRLRRVLDEKMRKLASLGQKKTTTENQMNENEEIVNKAVQMVVINTAIGILFKAPICFIPIVNTYAEFYYKSSKTQFSSPKFGEFYSWLFDTGFYELVSNLSDLLYMISIAIQFFIYYRFDKKFKQGLNNLIKNPIIDKKSKASSTTN